MPDRDEGFRLAEAGPTGMVLLRADLAAPAVAEAVRGAAGVPVPDRRRFTRAGDGTALWFAPDELLLLGPRAEAAALTDRLAAALAGTHHLAADVSDARMRFRLEGPLVREALAKGAPVDLAPAAFRPGDLRRTRLGQVACAFWCTGPESFELVCFRSVAGFVRDWLALAGDPAARVGFYPPA